MGLIIAPAIIAIIMILEAMARAEKYTEVFAKKEDGSYRVKEGVEIDTMNNNGQPSLCVKSQKFEIVEVTYLLYPTISKILLFKYV